MNKIEEIQKLKSLLDQGAITLDEFNILKKNVLDSTFHQQTSNDNSGKLVSEEGKNDTYKSMPYYLDEQKESVNYWAITLSAIMAIAVFLPWAGVSASVNSSYGNVHSDYSSGGIAGISIPGIGIVCLALAIAGGLMASKRVKVTFFAGLINFVNGLSYIFGWYNFGTSGSSTISYGKIAVSSSVSILPKFGLIIFIITSFVFAISTLGMLRSKVKRIDLHDDLKPIITPVEPEVVLNIVPEIISQNKSVKSSFWNRDSEIIMLEYPDGLQGRVVHRLIDNIYIFKANRTGFNYDIFIHYDSLENSRNGLHYNMKTGKILKAGYLGCYTN